MPFKVELLKDSNLLYCIDYVALKWVQGGRKSFTLSNEDQKSFFSVRIKLVEEGSCTLNWNLAVTNVPVTTVKKSYDFASGLKNSTTIRFTWLENSKVFLESKNAISPELPGEVYVEAINILAKVEEKLGLEILIPDRDFSEKDFQAIQELTTIVLCGRIEGNWTGRASLPIETAEPSIVREILSKLENGRQSNFLFAHPGRLKVLDTEVKLGDCERLLESVKLINQTELEDWLKGGNYSKQILVVVEPGDSNKLIDIYPKFLPLRDDEAQIESA